MKLNTKKKKSGGLSSIARRSSSDSETPSAAPERPVGGSSPLWMITGQQAQAEAVQKAKILQGSGRAPEIWFKDGESRLVRFRDSGPIACIFVYRFRLGGKVRFFTAASEEEEDLFRDELNARPTFRAIYEVFDYEGYVNKDKKQVKNIPRFYACSSKQYSHLEILRKKRQGLHNQDIEITRTGEGTSTSYMYMCEDLAPFPDKFKSIPRLVTDFPKYYAPLPVDEQRLMVRSISREPQGD